MGLSHNLAPSHNKFYLLRARPLRWVACSAAPRRRCPRRTSGTLVLCSSGRRSGHILACGEDATSQNVKVKPTLAAITINMKLVWQMLISIGILALVACATIRKAPMPFPTQQNELIKLHGSWYFYNADNPKEFKDSPVFRITGNNIFSDDAQGLCYFEEMFGDDTIERLRVLFQFRQNLQNCPNYVFFQKGASLDVRKADAIDSYPIYKIDFLDMKTKIHLPNNREAELFTIYAEIHSGKEDEAGMFGAGKPRKPISINRVHVAVVRGP